MNDTNTMILLIFFTLVIGVFGFLVKNNRE